MVGGVTRLGGLLGILSRATLSAEVAFWHEDVSRWGNLPSPGGVSITFASAPNSNQYNTAARCILKFFFRSLSGKIPLNRLGHHCPPVLFNFDFNCHDCLAVNLESNLPELLHILPRRLILLRVRRSRATVELYCCVAWAVNCLWRRLYIKKDKTKTQH